ncbi:MAG: hypothetical protein JKY65_15980 [Planctomycetes bacterium]|nr:hypothetical protein [Planctomycetota bacterium]
MPSEEEAPASAGAAFVPESDSEDLEVSILADGRVQIHARCRPGEDPSQCELRVQALVEALGVPEEVVVRKIEPREGDVEEPA